MRKLGKHKTGKCCLLVVCALACLASTACAPGAAGPHPGSRSAAETPPQPPIPPAAAAPDGGRGLMTDPPRNPWSDYTREVLFQPCGRCHRGDVPTRVPRALAVFDLLENPWYGRLTADQLDELLRRVRAIDRLPASDVETVESFVRCARDRVCDAGETESR